VASKLAIPDPSHDPGWLMIMPRSSASIAQASARP
jgi:hypothetical protein